MKKMREYRAATMIAVLGFSFLHFVFDTRVMKIISLFAIALKQHRFHSCDVRHGCCFYYRQSHYRGGYILYYFYIFLSSNRKQL